MINIRRNNIAQVRETNVCKIDDGLTAFTTEDIQEREGNDVHGVVLAVETERVLAVSAILTPIAES